MLRRPTITTLVRVVYPTRAALLLRGRGAALLGCLPPMSRCGGRGNLALDREAAGPASPNRPQGKGSGDAREPARPTDPFRRPAKSTFIGKIVIVRAVLMIGRFYPSGACLSLAEIGRGRGNLALDREAAGPARHNAPLRGRGRGRDARNRPGRQQPTTPVGGLAYTSASGTTEWQPVCPAGDPESV